MEAAKQATQKPKITRPTPLNMISQALQLTQENSNTESEENNSNSSSSNGSSSNGSSSNNSNTNNNDLPDDEPLGAKKPRATAARGKKPMTEMEYMQSKMKQQPLTVEAWVDARIDFPKFFKFTEEGDLEVPAIRPSDTKKIIRFEKYIPATADYTNDFLKNRRDAVIEPEREYTIAKRKLQELIMMFDPKSNDITVDDILDANEEVKEKECALNEVTKMPRNIRFYEDELKEKDLNFDIYARKKVAELVIQAEYTTFPIEAFWMPQGEQLVDNDNTVLPTKISLDDEDNSENYNTNDTNQSGGKTNRIVTDRVRGIIGARARAGNY